MAWLSLALVALTAQVQTGEDSLAKRVTLQAPRLTFAEFGAWAQRESGTPVYVVPAIRDRKLTILVENRPLREIMDRAAETLFLQWEKTKDGYTLRVDPDVLQEESRMADAEAAAQRLGIQREMDALAEYSRYSPTRLKSEIADAKVQLQELSKDSSPEAKVKSAALYARMVRLSDIDSSPYQRTAGRVLAQIPPARRAAILDGNPVFASNRPQDGLLNLTSQTIEDFQERDQMLKADSHILFSIKYEPLKGGLWMIQRRWEGGGSATALAGTADPVYRLDLPLQPMAKRLREWAVADPKVMATPLTVEKVEKEKVGPTPYRALAEILVDLHRRTGLPIVADGFRTAVVARNPPDGRDVKEWLVSMSNWSDQRFRGYKPLVRTGGDWLLMRHPQYWKQLRREIPERTILPLEAASNRSGGATLDDFARFAASLTPAQEPWTKGQDLVMNAPNKTFEDNIPFLRLWNALPNVMRRNAMSTSGLIVSTLQPSDRRLYYACLQEKRGSIFGVPTEQFAYWLSGQPFPEDMRLFVNVNSSVNVLDSDDVRYWSFFSNGQNGVPGASANLGTPADRNFASFTVPYQRGTAVKAVGDE